MRRLTQDDYKKLIPLKRLAAESSYSAGYVSILVQRDKLKAKKIGNKYYSTREWFEQYLKLHGRDNKKVSAAGTEAPSTQTFNPAQLKQQIDNLVEQAIEKKLSNGSSLLLDQAGGAEEEANFYYQEKTESPDLKNNDLAEVLSSEIESS